MEVFSDTLTQYRIHGIENIEKTLDKDLTNKEYWDSQLKNIDTRFGYIESYTNVLACDKSGPTLSLYMQDHKKRYILKKEYGAFTGEVKGDKYKEGDLKTPVGIYNLIKKISKVDSFYGPMAFVTSYPNIYDKYKGKNGSGIWIHGLPTEQERDEYTKGCIAINNQSIECLDRNIDIEKTILIIDEQKISENENKEIFSNLLSQLYEWRYAWLYSDIESYLNFYAPEFIRFDGMDIQRFNTYKTRVFKKRESKSIIFNNINVIPYPNSKNMYKITFYEIYKSNSFEFTGDKVLIVKLENNKMKIITEK
ncbi:L,D-transpeptidase family protein [Sulfurimonas aquatica]|uniref:L,D-transpeptidase family protein n=2 Tax=Sulfurimonas aquatica TaxID=2672570 RepID=A0A975GE40_9BACT|nr:L,D-transpeptidase family protein [Sulfurimonas aquatica]